ncbi:MAG: hypothetical protein J7K40_08500 [candidate division Zixibacteria bacterium]|nr:hypothetical protein [candidate division Zixibacteria bacterium]
MQIAFAGNTSAVYYCLEKLCRAGFNVAAVIIPEMNSGKALDIADFNSLAGEFDFRQIKLPLKSDAKNISQIDILIKLEWPDNQAIPIIPKIAVLGSNLKGQYAKEFLTDVAADIYNGKSQFESQLILEYANEHDKNNPQIETVKNQSKVISFSEVEINIFDDVRSIKTKTLANYYWHLLKLLNKIKNGGKILEPLSKEIYFNNIKVAGNINWNHSTNKIYNLVRSLTHPVNGAYTNYEGSRITIWRGHHFEMTNSEFEDIAPGTVVDILNEIGVLVKAGDGLFLITRIQPAGMPELPAWVWADYAHVRPFEVFEKIKEDIPAVRV